VSNETQPVDTEVAEFSHSWDDIHVQGQQNLRGSEGERSYVYDDSKHRPGSTQGENGWATLSSGLHVDGLDALGNPTVGWGHLVTDADRSGESHVAKEILGRPIDINDTTFSISSTEAEDIFQYDYNRHARGVRFISNIEDLSNDLISHVIDFIFNKGPDVFNPTIQGNWQNLRGAIESRDWDAAVEEVQKDWNVQPSRKDAFINSLLREAQFDNRPISTQPVPETVN
jgi:GH24 family phage-related lysozyme (muramidase)